MWIFERLQMGFVDIYVLAINKVGINGNSPNAHKTVLEVSTSLCVKEIMCTNRANCFKEFISSSNCTIHVDLCTNKPTWFGQCFSPKKKTPGDLSGKRLNVIPKNVFRKREKKCIVV